jgi:beta-phosphoglucomutase
MALKAVLFDFDGVLVNSEPLHHAALRDALRPEGIDIDAEEYVRTYLAFDDWEAVRLALRVHGQTAEPERVDAIASRKANLFEALLPGIPFFPGARELVRGLARELPVGIASGARRCEIEAILAAGGLRDSFTAIVGADDVTATKPDPEPYLAAMRLLAPRVAGLAPAECLVFEDSQAGIASGLAAGMKVVAVAHSYPAEQLGAADHVVPSLTGLTHGGLRAWFEA